MKRDFALRVDSLLSSVRTDLAGIADYMKSHILYGDLSEDEFNHYLSFIGKCMGETVKISNELYGAFPDIEPVELKSDPPKLK
jgi:hypothetical protein